MNTNNISNNNIYLLPIFILICFSFLSQCIHCKFNNLNKNIKVIKFNDLEEGIINECCICLNQINRKEKIIILPCKHYFHKSCLLEWYKKSKSCPTCRLLIN